MVRHPVLGALAQMMWSFNSLSALYVTRFPALQARGPLPGGRLPDTLASLRLRAAPSRHALSPVASRAWRTWSRPSEAALRLEAITVRAVIQHTLLRGAVWPAVCSCSMTCISG